MDQQQYGSRHNKLKYWSCDGNGRRHYHDKLLIANRLYYDCNSDGEPRTCSYNRLAECMCRTDDSPGRPYARWYLEQLKLISG